MMSVTMQPSRYLNAERFLFNAAIAISCVEYLNDIIGGGFFIKWPNDVYWRDRKAGGILIENLIQGQEWRWSVVGIGINVNQIKFHKHLLNPVSLKIITGRNYTPTDLAEQLQKYILKRVEGLSLQNEGKLMEIYNSFLYKQGLEVQLRKENVVFKTIISEVNKYGNLLTKDAIDRSFTFGEVSWVNE
jgi:BirA family biotin operon repressor/biotin-[acetyl-CoA-carboxylase] ligase